MKLFTSKQVAASVLSAALVCTAIPASFSAVLNNASITSATAADAAATEVIFSSGFENGEGISEFSGRGGVEVIEAASGDAHSGDYSMKIGERTASWNGPQLALGTRCKAGVEYKANAWVKAAWYNTIKLSLQYTDSSGETHYDNLKSVVSQGEWVEITETKFSFPEDATDVYIYIESSDTADLYVDDFTLRTAEVYNIDQNVPSLKELYSQYFKVGTAVTTSELAPQSAMDLIEKHFNSITLGNELKPESLLDKNASIAAGNDNPQVNIASARSILNYCRDNNVSVRGHVLVWHSQTPDWFFKENYDDNGAWVDKETMLKRMENYIKNVFAALEEEYPTVDFYAWDVVNEAWLDDGSHRKAGGYNTNPETSGWVSVFGDNSFIEPAFEYARKYAPEGCKLYYNDFNEYMPQKTAAIVEMANSLKEKGLIDGIGMQSHLDVRSGSDAFPSASVYKKALAAFAETGLDVQITELDATVNGNTDELFEAQAQYYSDIMDAIVEYKDSISAVVFWGTTDDKSWRASKYPLLFNDDFTAKPAFYSIIDGLDIPPVTTTAPADTTTTTTTTTTTEPPTDIIYGDANDDGELGIADVVKVMMYASDKDANPMTDKELDNADVNNRGDGVFISDALSIQKKLAQVIDELPESYMAE